MLTKNISEHQFYPLNLILHPRHISVQMTPQLRGVGGSFIYYLYHATGVSVGILLQYNLLGAITDTYAK